MLAATVEPNAVRLTPLAVTEEKLGGGKPIAMRICEIYGASGGRGFLLNSWGETAHTGPTGIGDPSPAGFWADAAVLDRMLRQGDSWAFSGIRGFPARKLDWYARLQHYSPQRTQSTQRRTSANPLWSLFLCF